MNFVKFTIADTLDYIAYFALNCNGTVLVAEIHRRCMCNPKKYIGLYLNSESMYDFLCTVNKEIAPDKAIGSCTESRFMFSSGSNSTKWNEKQDDLFALCLRYYAEPSIIRSRSRMKEVTSTIITDLISKRDPVSKKPIFSGAGAMGANQFVHIAALLGVIPLACYTFAEIRDESLGPGQFINRALKSDIPMSALKCNLYMDNLHAKFSTIWNDLPTENFIENTLCVCKRSYDNTIRSISNRMNVDVSRLPVTVIMKEKYVKESRTKELYFMDERRGCMQSFFTLRTSGKGSSLVRPSLMMKLGSQWRSGDGTTVRLTNWNTNDNKDLISWGSARESLSLDTKINVSRNLQSLLGLQ